MKNLMCKEMKLSAAPISFIFILFSIMTMIPGYPILVGTFFICFGIFQSFQNACMNNDVLYTVLLPIKKTDVVKAKYGFAIIIQMISFAIILILTIIRMTLMSDLVPYANNAMMNANQIYLTGNLLIFALFNLIFVGGFFKTVCKCGKPFLVFSIASFVVITLVEALHHIPGVEALNGTDTMGNITMWLIFAVAVVVYAGVSVMSCKRSIKRFEMVDM